MALTKIPASLLDTSSGINGLIYPTSDGTSGQFLKTDGSGNLTFATTYTDSDVETYLDGGTSTPTFASATVSGTLTVTGDLDITGDINSYNVTDLDVTDQTITLGAGQTEANSGGSGIIIDGSNASILWDETNDEWDFNKGVNIDGGAAAYNFAASNSMTIDNSSGYAAMEMGGSSGAYIDLKNPSSDDYDLRLITFGSGGQIISASGSDLLLASSGNSNQLYLDSSGTVGIGTSSPASVLDVRGARSDLLRLYSTEAGGNAEIELLTLNNASSVGKISKITATQVGADTNGSILAFSTSPTISNTPAERMRIDSSGKVYFGNQNNAASSGYIDKQTSGDYEFKIHASTSTTTDRAITFHNRSNTEAMRIDSSGRLLVGTTNTNPHLLTSGKGIAINQGIFGIDAACDNIVGIFNRTDADGTIVEFKKGGALVGSIGSYNGVPYIGYASGAGGGIMFNGKSIEPTALGSSRTNGENDIGSSNYRWKALYLSGGVSLGGNIVATGVTTSVHAWKSTSNSTSASKHMIFANPNGNVGDIRTNGSATAYITSSDYRLKENVNYDFNALDRVAQLKPARFNFIADADTTVDGFLAHEVQDIVPEAIAGEKDAVREEEYEITPAVLDDDGNVITEAEMGTREVPDYQGIDQSKLVPLLTKAIQEQQTIIDDLKSRIETLEG
jgi:hypothetical protein